MPYILSGIIDPDWPGLFGEGAPYQKNSIIDIRSNNPELPPVNYDSHTLKPHSIPHVDFPGHIIAGGKTSEDYFKDHAGNCFWGPALVVHLKAEQGRWQALQDGTRVWRVTPAELERELKRVGVLHPSKLFLSVQGVEIMPGGYIDPCSVVVLTPEAAEYLIQNSDFNALGTPWKSSDFEPGSRERPVHKILLRQAVLFECLRLSHVPEGEYFFSGFPLALSGATESPVTAVLYTREELDWKIA